jgi:hypothetical protein
MSLTWGDSSVCSLHLTTQLQSDRESDLQVQVCVSDGVNNDIDV